MNKEIKLSIPNELVSEIKKLDPNIQEEKIPDIISVISHSVEVRSIGQIFTGPLPAPEILQGYENVLAGSAERIIKMTENQAQHRQNCEKKLIDANIKNESKGSMFAFLITIMSISCGTFLIYAGRDITGLAVIITELIGLVSVFLVGKIIGLKAEKSNN